MPAPRSDRDGSYRVLPEASPTRVPLPPRSASDRGFVSAARLASRAQSVLASWSALRCSARTKTPGAKNVAAEPGPLGLNSPAVGRRYRACETLANRQSLTGCRPAEAHAGHIAPSQCILCSMRTRLGHACTRKEPSIVVLAPSCRWTHSHGATTTAAMDTRAMRTGTTWWPRAMQVRGLWRKRRSAGMCAAPGMEPVSEPWPCRRC